MDINQKSIEKEPRPKHDSRKQLPEGTSSKSKNPHDDEFSENEKKLSKEHSEEKEALIIAVNNCVYVFFPVNYVLLTSLNSHPTTKTINIHLFCAKNLTAFFKKFKTLDIIEFSQQSILSTIVLAICS